ncbi:MAG: hypothetical protein R3E57_06065 [Porticoccaceae bacterium]
MSIVCGIYGYSITRPIVLGELRIEPRTQEFQQAKSWARDLDSYRLTAVLCGPTISETALFNLEAVLSFVEHLDVIITSPVETSGEDPFSRFPERIESHKRNNGGGAVIGEDAFFPSSRSEFVSKAFACLGDSAFCQATQFNILFFKCVETFRQPKAFVEIKYFLLYSGLETYARAVVDDRETKNSSERIYKLLTDYGFDVKIENPSNLKKAVSSYTHLRNALFHNSQISVQVNINGKMVEFAIVDYMFNFSQLVVLVILKALRFEDGHINWNSWIDGQPFI